VRETCFIIPEEEYLRLEECKEEGMIGFAEWKVLNELSVKEIAIYPNKKYGIGVNLKYYKWLGQELIELSKICHVRLRKRKYD